MQTGGATDLRTCAAQLPRNLTDVCLCQIRMVHGDGSIDEPDSHVWSTVRVCHQWGQPDYIHSVHRPDIPLRAPIIASATPAASAPHHSTSALEQEACEDSDAMLRGYK